MNSPALTQLLIHPRLTQSITLLLLLASGWQGAALTWQLLPLPELPALPQRSGAADGGVRATPESRPTLAPVAGLHLFGREQVAPVAPPKPRPVVVQETRLNLTLKGVFTHQQPERAFAIISAPGKPDLPYRIGDSVGSGALLAEIHSDQVLLERNGRFETLKLPQQNLGLAATAPAPTTPPASAAQRLPGRELRALRSRLVRNPTEVWKLARMQPIMLDGQLRGYQLNPGRDPKLFRELGLEPNDLITEVNGIPLNDTSRIGSIFTELTNANQLAVTLERNGSPQRLQLDFTR